MACYVREMFWQHYEVSVEGGEMYSTLGKGLNEVAREVSERLPVGATFTVRTDHKAGQPIHFLIRHDRLERLDPPVTYFKRVAS